MKTVNELRRPSGNSASLGEATHHEVRREARQSRPEEEAEGTASCRTSSNQRRDGGVEAQQATARNWLRKGGVTQRLCAALSSRTRSHVPTHCSCTLAGSPAPPWVAGSPVAFLVATPWWPPDRCAGRSTSGRPPPWCPQGGLLPAGRCWTRLLSSMWGDRVMTAQQ